LIKTPEGVSTIEVSSVNLYAAFGEHAGEQFGGQLLFSSVYMEGSMLHTMVGKP